MFISFGLVWTQHKQLSVEVQPLQVDLVVGELTLLNNLPNFIFSQTQ